MKRELFRLFILLYIIGLFQRGIMMSGSALSPWAMSRDSVKYTRQVARELNCPTDDNRALIECLRNRYGHYILI